MTNAERCRARAANYQAMADLAGNEEARRAFLRLADLWLEMVSPAERFDRRHDAETRQAIFAMIDQVERRHVA